MRTRIAIRNAARIGGAVLCLSLLSASAQAADLLTINGIMEANSNFVDFGHAGVGGPYAPAPGYGTFQVPLNGTGIFAADTGGSTTGKIQSLNEPVGAVILPSAFLTFDTGTTNLEAWVTSIVAAPGGGLLSIIDTPTGASLSFEVDGFIRDTSTNANVDNFTMDFSAQFAGETKAQLLQNMPLNTTFSAVLTTNPISAAPEPGAWGLMLTGFFGIGTGLRRRRAAHLAVT